MTSKNFFLCTFAFLLLVGFQQNSYALNGSFKTYFSELKDPNSDSWDAAMTNTFRPKVTWALNEHYTFYGAYAFSANFQKPSVFTPTSQSQTVYRAYDFKTQLYNSSHTDSTHLVLNHNLDRFYMSYATTDSSVTLNVGRAPVAFGSAKIINPTDVLTPYSYQTLDKEERLGVDTVRMNIALGPLSLIDMGYVFGDKFKTSKSAAFARLKVNYFQTDISAMLMDFQDNFLVGLDFARSIGNASTWLEAAHVIPKYFENSKNNLDNYFRGTIGMDYKLTPEIYTYVEYHYNGAGAIDPKKYLQVQTTTAYTEGGVSLQGVHYLAPGVTYEASSLWKFTGQLLFNLKDTSLFNNILVEHNFAEDVYVDLGAYLPAGRSTQQFVQKSEFGVYPKIFYSSLRFYF